ncbi:MAG: NUDIX hydrolase [Marinosulfonomonas sp.]
MTQPAIQDAATVIVIRDAATRPSVLMGQRSRSAAFMPGKFVFPGGALEAGDEQISLATALSDPCRSRLRAGSHLDLADALAAAAIRELWEETGLVLGQRGGWSTRPAQPWRSFAALDMVPTAAPLHFVFRAVTPPGRPRRFDARFFLCDAAHIHGDLDDFSNADGELDNLQWVPFPQLKTLDIAFITEVVLAEISQSLPKIGPPDTVPFFRNSDEQTLFERIGRPMKG